MRLRPYRPLLITLALTALVTAAFSLFTFGGGITTDPCTGIVANAGRVEFSIHEMPGNSGFSISFPDRYSPNAPRLLPAYDTSTSPVPPMLTSRTLRIPVWLFAAPILTFQLYRAVRKRPTPGHCPRCNYDVSTLSATRCPECGSAIPLRPDGGGNA